MSCDLMPYERTFVVSLVTILPAAYLMELLGVFPATGHWAVPFLCGLMVCFVVLFAAMCWDACKN